MSFRDDSDTSGNRRIQNNSKKKKPTWPCTVMITIWMAQTRHFSPGRLIRSAAKSLSDKKKNNKVVCLLRFSCPLPCVVPNRCVSAAARDPLPARPFSCPPPFKRAVGSPAVEAFSLFFISLHHIFVCDQRAFVLIVKHHP